MTNTYAWTINQLDCYPTNPKPNCVFNIHWTLTATSLDINPQTNKPYSVYTYGNQTIQYDDSESYIPYENLTHDIIVSWIEESMNKTEMPVSFLKDSLDARINNEITPPVVKPALPWST